VLLIAILAAMARRHELPAVAARRTYRGILVRATLTAGAMAALHVAGAAYLGIRDPQAGTWPLQALNTFLPALLAAVAVLWVPALVIAIAPGLAARRRGAWLRVVAPAGAVPLWTAGVLAASTLAYAGHLGGWVALQVLYG
jgi:hypothetical protein